MFIFLASTAFVHASTGFVTVNGTQFVLNGKPFNFAGTNNYYLWYKPWYQTEEVLNDNRDMNLTVIRTWGFCAGQWKEGYCFQPEAGVYDEATFQKMDKLIKEAGDRNIRLMIPLVNNWDDFGGMCQYVAWCSSTIPDYDLCSPLANPGTPGATVHDAFYNNSCTRNLYKKYVEYFLNRTNTLTGIKYKDDPTIFAWQLANEPRARSDQTGQILYNWVSEMSSYIKSMDSRHLITTGEDGFYLNKGSNWKYNGYDGQDFITHNQISTIDFASYNMYLWDISFEESLGWIGEHAEDAHNIIGKPLTLNEFGYSQPLRDEYMQGWYSELEKTWTNGDLFWMLCDNSYPDYDGFCVYYPTDSTTVSVITSHASVMKNRNFTLNHPPVLQTMEDITVNETKPVVITANATDPDGDQLQYYINDSRFVKNMSTFTWQTHYGDAGTYHFTVTVSDGRLADQKNLTVRVLRQNLSCVIPTNGMNITNSTALCRDVYHFPNGINIVSNNVVLDCNGSTIIGNNTRSGISIFSSNNIAKNCFLQSYGVGISVAGTNNTVENNIILSCHTGISSSGNDQHLIRNIISNAWDAFWIGYSNGNIIVNNTAMNSARGFLLDTVSNSIFTGNKIRNNFQQGIVFWFLIRYNNFTGNILSGNNDGIYAGLSGHGNLIYLNIFLDNSIQYYDNRTNSWDNGSAGNFWKDYNTPAEGCYDIDSNGICDSPYYINGNGTDHYPLARAPFSLPGDINGDCKVDIFDLAQAGMCFGRLPVDFCAPADINGDSSINIIDLASVGKNFGWSC
jgi:parallel beta-helix repeat protein